MTESLYEGFSRERKRLQAEGLVPDWYISGGLQMFQEKYEYQTNGQSVKGQFTRIARTVAKQTKLKDYDEEFVFNKFFELLWKGWLSPSTPVLANTGTDRGLPISCSGAVIPDSIHGFYSTQLETAMLTKNGFGTSAYLGDIRPRGSKISIGGKSSGALPVYKDFVQLTRDVAQGTARRGAWAGYLPINHGDFDEICDFINSEPDDANIGWVIFDEDIAKLDAGDKDMTRRFQKVMKLKMTLGKGYYCFIDKINRKRPAMYKKHGLTVKASNLCFTGDTLVATADGRNAVSIGDLAKNSNGVNKFPVYSSRWNSIQKKWVNEIKNAVAFKTGHSKVIQITLSDGSTFKCTPDHKLALKAGGYISASEAVGKELKPFFTSLGVTRKYRHINSVTNGYAKQHSLIWNFNNGEVPDGFHIDHIENIPNDSLDNLQLLEISDHLKKTSSEFKGKNNAVHKIRDIEANFVNRSVSATLSSNGRYKGLSNADIYNLAVSLKEQGINLNFPNMILADQRMPASFSKNRFGGCFATLVKMVNDGKFEDRWFATDRAIPNIDKGYKVESISVLSIEDAGSEDVFDLTVEDNHNFNIITNTKDSNYLECSGVLVHNCDEITLFADEEHTYTCVLSSMNLAKYDEWKDTDAVFWATIFLDGIVSEFLDKARKIKGLEKAVRFTEKGRALALGACGLHTYFQEHMMPWDSIEAHITNKEMFQHINKESLRASKFLAVELGEPEWCKGFGVRNTHRMAVPPTKSTALLMGGVSEGINPDPAMSYTMLTSAGEVERVNLVLLKIMKEKGVFNKKTLKSLKESNGSVQRVDWLTDHQKKVFETAFEINQEEILMMAAARGDELDQWQSLNIFLPAEASPRYVAKLHKIAFKNEKILGLYYITTQAGVQGAVECVACQ